MCLKSDHKSAANSKGRLQLGWVIHELATRVLGVRRLVHLARAHRSAACVSSSSSPLLVAASSTDVARTVALLPSLSFPLPLLAAGPVLVG